MALHGAQMVDQRGRKRVPIRKAREAGKKLEPRPIGRQGVGLLIGDHLQPVFHRAQEAISGAEIIAHEFPDPASIGQHVEGP